jgi:prevent-host-death family protein
VREAESGKAVELTRRGERVAVLIGLREYERLVSRSRRFSDAWAEFARDPEFADVEVDPDEVFGGVRDASLGRDTQR